MSPVAFGKYFHSRRPAGFVLGLLMVIADLALAPRTGLAEIQAGFFSGAVDKKTEATSDLPEFAIWRIDDEKATSKGVFHVAWSADGKSIALQNRGNLLTVFDVPLRSKRFSILKHENNWIESIDYSSDSNFVLTAAGSGETVKVVDASSGELVLELNTTAMAAYFSRCGGVVTVLGRENVERYSFPEGKLQMEIPWRIEEEAAVGMSKEGELLVTYRSVGRQNYLSEIVLPATQTRIRMAGGGAIPGNVAISHCQRRIAVDYPDENRIFFWEMHDSQAVRYLLREHREPIQGLAISPCGRLLGSVDSAGNIIVWDLILRQPIQRLIDDSQDCRHLAFSYSGEYLLTSSAGVNNQSATVWDLRPALYREQFDRPNFEQLWTELGSAQVKNSLGASTRLIRQFADFSIELRQQIEAELGDSTSGDLNQWIEQLNDRRYEIRETATERLAYLHSELRPILLEHLDEETVPEIRYRLKKILRDGKRSPKISLADARRWQRLIFVLEKANSSTATELLNLIALRHEHSRIREEAKDSLKRHESP